MNAQLDADHSCDGARALDTAKGILLTLRRCSLAEAFDEILGVATTYQVGVLAVCSELVRFAEDRLPRQATPASEAVYRAWGPLLLDGPNAVGARPSTILHSKIQSPIGRHGPL